jgi:ATP-dependent DNA ligase
VSKRLGSPYRSGRVERWLKIKNPVSPAVRHEAEEDWDGRRREGRLRAMGGYAYGKDNIDH